MDTMRLAQRTPKFYRVAIQCGAVPLGIGLSFFVAWLVTRDFSFVLIGVAFIIPLLIVIGYGFLALLGYAIAAHLDRRVKIPRFWPSFLLAALLLSANFPAAYAVRHATLTIGTQYRIEIRNAGAEPLLEVFIRYRDERHAVDEIPPGGRVRLSLPIPHKSQVHLEAVTASTKHEALVSEYVPSEGGLIIRKIVTVHPDGEVSVREAHGFLFTVFDWAFEGDSATAHPAR